MFVDSLLTVQTLNHQQISQLKLDRDPEQPDRALRSASQLLSDVTRMAGVVLLPKRSTIKFTHIEFLPLPDAKLLVILVTDDQQVQNKIIHSTAELSPSELQQASNYLNTLLKGKTLLEVRKCLVTELDETREKMNQSMIQAIELAQKTLAKDAKHEQYVLTGETNLMDFSELSSVGYLRQLFEAFNQKQGIIQLLDQCLDAEGVHIFIGEESGWEALGGCSVVTSTYSISDEIVGVLGVIGPTRMEYERVIPVVDVTAKLLAAALNPKS